MAKLIMPMNLNYKFAKVVVKVLRFILTYVVRMFGRRI